MTASLSYRLASVDDADVLVPIINLAYRGEQSWTTEAHLVKNERITKNQFISQVKEGTSPIFVALNPSSSSPDAPIGCIQVENYDPDTDKYVHDNSTSAIILGLFAVDPDHQSQGVGRFLIQTALDFAKKENKTWAYVWVISLREDIKKWYTRLGFKDTGRTVDFVMPENALVNDMYFNVWKREL